MRSRRKGKRTITGGSPQEKHIARHLRRQRFIEGLQREEMLQKRVKRVKKRAWIRSELPKIAEEAKKPEPKPDTRTKNQQWLDDPRNQTPWDEIVRDVVANAKKRGDI